MNAMNTTIASSDVIADRSSRSPAASTRCRNWLIGPAIDSSARRHAEHDQTALDHAPPRQELAVGVEQQDAHHDAATERQDDDRDVLRLQAERRLGEVGAEHPKNAHERRRDAEIEQRPSDRAVLADDREPLAELIDRGVHGGGGLAHGRRTAVRMRWWW
jgi:hypothetical protein